jgi:ubiquinol-cytochrome c reductase subunit 7
MAYQANVAKSLSVYGLKYEDCLIEKPAVVEAIDLSSPEINVGRTRRLKRAMDLSFKRKDLNVYAPELADPKNLKPFELEISGLVEKIERRDEEHDLVNKGW